MHTLTAPAALIAIVLFMLSGAFSFWKLQYEVGCVLFAISTILVAFKVFLWYNDWVVKGPDRICWNRFIDCLVMSYNIMETTENSMIRAPLDYLYEMKTLGKLIVYLKSQKIPNWETIVVYVKVIGPHDRRNHISLEQTGGLAPWALGQIPYSSDIWYAEFWDFNTLNNNIGDALAILIGDNAPKSGNAPMLPSQLRAQRLAIWNAQVGNIRLWRSTKDEATLPSGTVGITQVQTNENAIAAYFQGNDANIISAHVAMAMNADYYPGKNTGIQFFRAIGCPQINGENVYYEFPGGMTNASILAGLSAQHGAIVNKARTSVNLKLLGVISHLLSKWGYPILTPVQLQLANGNNSNDWCMGNFTWGGGYIHELIHDDMLVLVRHDINLIITKMADQKEENKKRAKKLPMVEIPETEFKFFKKAGVAVKTLAEAAAAKQAAGL
jgi:hypothetical protein